MENKGILESSFVRNYILGGKAIFTAVSLNTGSHLTFKVKSKEDKEKNEKMYFVSVLCGSDNTSNYMCIGTIKEYKGKMYFNVVKKMQDNPPKSAQVFAYIFERYVATHNPNEKLEIYHHGTCSRCGRLLTDPDSIRMGLGPICVMRAA